MGYKKICSQSYKHCHPIGLLATLRGFFTPRRTLIGAVMTVMGRLDEEHWDIDQVLEGWEPRDAGAALNDAGDDL